MTSLNPGQSFGSYEIVKLLGRGGMGEVYLARDTRLKRPVAIKVLSDGLTENLDLLSRFRKEAGLAAILNHPNICTIYEIGESNGQTYICMEYVEGKTLRERIAGEPMELLEVLEISIQISDALEEARKQNIVHRDIKSSNILLTNRGTVKILDFGLAKQIRNQNTAEITEAITESFMTQTGEVRGTIAYMSPEQALGKQVDHRSDIFSFGIVMYEMLTGRLPFTGNSTTAVLDAILHKSALPPTRYNDKIPESLLRVLNKMLEKDADLRYQSVHEVWVDLRHIRGESTATAAQPPVQEGLPNKRRLLLPFLIAILVISVAASLLYFRRNALSTRTMQAGKGSILSIAVLPFRFTGEDPTRLYLGMLATDALIAGLQPVPGIAIAPYANIREIKASAPISKVAKDLGVDWVVRGIVASNEEDIEITPELFSSDGKTIWKETVRGRPVVALDIAKKGLLTALHQENPSSKEISQLRTPNIDAYQKYLEARSRHEGWDVKENLDEAVDLYRATLQIDSDFGAAHAGLAIALVSQFHRKREAGLLSAADEQAQRALTLNPDLPEALLASGMVKLESGHSVEAGALFERALEVAPGNDAACRSMAEMYATLGRNKEAREMYHRAIALRPYFWTNYYDLGTFEFVYAGDLEAARVNLEKAGELNPQGYAALVMLGNICLLQGQLEKAENYFRKTLEGGPNPYAYNNLGMVYYYRGRYDLALRNWRALVNEAPDKPMYHTNVADALRQMGQTEEARAEYKDGIQRFRAALKSNPVDDKSRAGLGMALAAMGQCAEALQETQTVLTRHPGRSEYAIYGAIATCRCGDYKTATRIVLDSIAADTVVDVRFNPDLEPIRKVPEVREALKRAGLPISSGYQSSDPQ